MYKTNDFDCLKIVLQNILLSTLNRCKFETLNQSQIFSRLCNEWVVTH